MTSSARACLLLLPLLSSALASPVAAQAPRPGAIMGWWHGTSTCVKASWNSACNDEVTAYEFVPVSPDSMRSTVHGFKIVAGQRDSMGDLPVSFVPDARVWNADFSTSRGDMRWSFQVHGDTLVGQLLHFPNRQVARHVLAVRGSGQ